MMALLTRNKPDLRECAPRAGDTLVKLTVDEELPLEQRMDLLSYSFAKIVQGAVLRQIEQWDLRRGCIEFIVGGGAARPGPRGKINAELSNWPVDAEVQTL